MGEISFFRHATDKMPTDDDLLVLLHTLFFGSAGKNTMRKRQLRLFAGFPEDSPSRSTLVEKVSNSKKWTVSMLKAAADVFGMEKGGSREELVERFVDYIISPSELKDVPAPKAKTSKKRKAAGKKAKKEKSDKPKRAPSAFIMYSQASRERIKAENPDATFGEVARLLGVAWKALGEKEKAVWVATAAEAAAANGDAEEGGKKKKRKKTAAAEDSKADSSDEGSGGEESGGEESGGNEEEEDRDKDLFPDSGDEA